MDPQSAQGGANPQDDNQSAQTQGQDPAQTPPTPPTPPTQDPATQGAQPQDPNMAPPQGIPQQGTPQGAYPQGYYPPVPPQGMPQGMPQQGTPQGAYPPGYYPPMPPQGMPQQGDFSQQGQQGAQGFPPGAYPPPQGFPPGAYPQPQGMPPVEPEDTTPANFQLGTKFPPKLNVTCPAHELNFNEEYFIRLLAGSISLSKDEKKRIVESIPKLKQAQIDELIRIFEEEKQKFAALSKKHVPQLEKLADQHYKEWMDLETEFFQEGKKQEDTSKADEIRKQLGL
ncbi:MAG: hypothetical protein PHP74_00490 [Candidatus Gracilibacteria bacterium]|nr:hypothetical protein [Candidatus Gracilibacteria bacterium]